MTTQHFSDEELLSVFDGMYGGDKDPGDIREYTMKVVRTRKVQKCPGVAAGKQHEVPAGSRMVREHALVDGAWRSCYTCEQCVLWWAIESGQAASLNTAPDAASSDNRIYSSLYALEFNK